MPLSNKAAPHAHSIPRLFLILLYSTTTAGFPWDPPKPTQTLDSTAGGSVHRQSVFSPPRITPSPQHGPAENLIRRQEDGRATCGYIGGISSDPIACDAGLACVTNANINAAACCPTAGAATSLCAIPTTCMPSSALSTCGSDCASDPFILKCSDPTNPYCATYFYDYTTATPTNLGCAATPTAAQVLLSYTDHTTLPLSSSSSPPAAIPSNATATGTPSSTDTGAIAGGVIGGVGGLGILLLLVFCICIRRKKKDKREEKLKKKEKQVRKKYEKEMIKHHPDAVLHKDSHQPQTVGQVLFVGMPAEFEREHEREQLQLYSHIERSETRQENVSAPAHLAARWDELHSTHQMHPTQQSEHIYHHHNEVKEASVGSIADDARLAVKMTINPAQSCPCSQDAQDSSVRAPHGDLGSELIACVVHGDGQVAGQESMEKNAASQQADRDLQRQEFLQHGLPSPYDKEERFGRPKVEDGSGLENQRDAGQTIPSHEAQRRERYRQHQHQRQFSSSSQRSSSDNRDSRYRTQSDQDRGQGIIPRASVSARRYPQEQDLDYMHGLSTPPAIHQALASTEDGRYDSSGGGGKVAYTGQSARARRVDSLLQEQRWQDGASNSSPVSPVQNTPPLYGSDGSWIFELHGDSTGGSHYMY